MDIPEVFSHHPCRMHVSGPRKGYRPSHNTLSQRYRTMTRSSLTLIDEHCVLQCVVPNTFVPAALAALAAEPETIDELELALTRYVKISPGSQIISALPASAGNESLLDFAIDLRNRIVATSTGSLGRSGYVNYHEFLTPTDLRFPYLVSDDWLFTTSVSEYESLRKHASRTRARTSRPDARAVLYGPPVLHFITAECKRVLTPQKQMSTRMETIKSHWLSCPRYDLAGKSPRKVLLEKRHFIDTDLNARECQWKIQGVVPACLPRDSSAYRYAGFGSIECLVYCEMLESSILAALENTSSYETDGNIDPLVQWLANWQRRWLTTPDEVHGGRVPAQIIDWERRRLPLVCAANAKVPPHGAPQVSLVNITD
jgi:hypothetical protein